MMSLACRLIVITFAMLYAAAFVLFLIGTYGLFGSPQGPLAGIFIVPLGMPWILWLDNLPSALRPASAFFAPALNLLMLWGLCAWWARR